LTASIWTVLILAIGVFAGATNGFLISSPQAAASSRRLTWSIQAARR
jgi:hypothetical protein